MKTVKYKHLALFLLSVILLTGCTQTKEDQKKKSENASAGGFISKDMPMSQRMAESIIMRNPDLCMIDSKEPKWAYVPGLVGKAMIELWKKTGKQKYFDYAEAYADTIIDEDGWIHGQYERTKFNIDKINSGKILFELYDETQNEKYKKAIEVLRKQLEWMPRTTQGGFWHKRRYPWQMWLDGLYMGSPFYARYAMEFIDSESFNDVTKQFTLIAEKTYDQEAGLFYHGWDESRLQRWADPETGLSANFWSRAIGWYAMALVDVLDYLPQDHPKRDKIISIFKKLVDGIENYQDETGLWYQVVDQGNREGNYLEATGSSMFIYSIAKAVKKGYIDQSYFEIAEKSYQGLLNELIEVEDNGEVNLTQCCSGAGLGGEDPYRDGSYEYYINEEVVKNDGKGTGPFIMASLLMEEMTE